MAIPLGALFSITDESWEGLMPALKHRLRDVFDTGARRYDQGIERFPIVRVEPDYPTRDSGFQPNMAEEGFGLPFVWAVSPDCPLYEAVVRLQEWLQESTLGRGGACDVYREVWRQARQPKPRALPAAWCFTPWVPCICAM